MFVFRFLNVSSLPCGRAAPKRTPVVIFLCPSSVMRASVTHTHLGVDHTPFPSNAFMHTNPIPIGRVPLHAHDTLLAPTRTSTSPNLSPVTPFLSHGFTTPLLWAHFRS
ncbi:uncharacterized protein LACBIDRAFT_303029 [Laccaria bicolor S238N-H82]|uniref:Predicted protein n=1 Tax=Laccaria bicolor (strain S238N-H82 / ATCC MYA-4686) TaxID=486041 RepID=B0DIT0_LACBS|nr:uncharacterized protein LACBIDRAFT_303029 [Laccaria bicolor S238N-H82]EDR05397.1 predicted protein [Laccaria bicolor S238N-H82]|eukprot:XP_001883955.1 predicted protein [Laccaria bicolor S238N-H82]